jgi:transposase-like protein
MSRHSTSEDREYALERLHANRGDVARTAEELGLATSTLYRWVRLRNENSFSLSSFSPNLSFPAAVTSDAAKSLPVIGEGLPPDDLQALRELKLRMLQEADYISRNIRPAVEESTLAQRLSALTQLIDYVAKLATLLPAPEKDEIEEVILLYEGEKIDEEDTDEASDGASAFKTSGDFG